MRKQISYMHHLNLIEVAPSPLIHPPHRASQAPMLMHHSNLTEVVPSPVIHPHKVSQAPMLETIVEEAGLEKEAAAAAAKVRPIYLLPVVLSFVTYALVSRLPIV
ncbi:hypothetical protein AAHA92_11513 [Salvia divinorum]|uniref:Uncharacterized protein n=1 Tax=Salvia divinorum TaxID=28513 RepID=A0ABD1HKH8_SALDI